MLPIVNMVDSDAIITILEDHFASLPTLIDYKGNFQLLISVILTANTTDAQVNKVTPQLFARYPDAFAMAQCKNVSIIEHIIRSVGLAPTKARNIHRTAHILAQKYHGVVPLHFESLLELPGVGRKSASVILCRSTDTPAVIVDTHYTRVTRRIGLTTASSPRAIEEDTKKCVRKDKWCSFSQRINILGRVYCTARIAHCTRCPIRKYCQFGMAHHD